MFNILAHLLIDIVSGVGTMAVNLLGFWLPFIVVATVVTTVTTVWGWMKS